MFEKERGTSSSLSFSTTKPRGLLDATWGACCPAEPPRQSPEKPGVAGPLRGLLKSR